MLRFFFFFFLLPIFHFVVYRKSFISLVKLKYFQLGGNINTFHTVPLGVEAVALIYVVCTAYEIKLYS